MQQVMRIITLLINYIDQMKIAIHQRYAYYLVNEKKHKKKNAQTFLKKLTLSSRYSMLTL